MAGGLWTWDKLSVELKETLYGRSSAYQSRTGCPWAGSATCYKVQISAAEITDLAVSDKILDSTKLSVRANSLFNKYPDKLNPALKQDFLSTNTNSFVTVYPSFSPFGINGCCSYGRLTFTF